MLFSYTYINHDMEIMQSYMDYIFYEVWLKSSEFDEFELTLFDNEKDLQEIMKTFYYLPENKDSIRWGRYFLERVKDIFEIFKMLDDNQLKQLEYWYEVNNKIEALCDGENSPIMYKELDLFHKELSGEIYKLYSNLYNKKVIGLKDFTSRIGKIDDHYKKFMSENTQQQQVCPFCGINEMKGIYHTKREAYDHYLPKVQYPFNSINFKNLVPMCHECNSSYKSVSNPIFTKEKKRRKSFYPYAMISPNIQISVNLSSSDIIPKNIKLVIKSTTEEKLKTWKELFSIEERYKAIFSGVDARYWLTQVVDEANIRSESCEKCFSVKKELARNNPYNEKNFLKIPFLEACQRIGLF